MRETSYDQVETMRRLQSLVMVGTVHEADYKGEKPDNAHKKPRVRLKVGDMITGWLPWMAERAGKDRKWWAPDVGEQVVVLSPGGDPAQGIILKGAVYQNKHDHNATDPDLDRTDYSNGAYVEHNRKSGAFTIRAKGNVTIETDGNVVIKGARVDLNP